MGISIDFFDPSLASSIVGAKFRGMYEGFYRALEAQGCRVTLSTSEPLKDAGVSVISLWASIVPKLESIIEHTETPIVLHVPPAYSWFETKRLERWRNKILFAYEVDAAKWNFKCYESLGIPYKYLPFGSDPTVMRPLDLPRLYDIVFVGSLGHKRGRHRYIEALLPAVQDRRCLFIGEGWESYNIPYQLVAWGDLLNVIYNLAHVCLNVHNDDEKMGIETALNLNPRLFDYAMAGCFQVSDNPEAVRLHFEKDEIIAVANPKEWVEQIVYYLDHSEETESYRKKALQRAMREHTWHHRAVEFIEMIEASLNKRQISEARLPRRSIAAFIRDHTLILADAAKQKVRARLKR